MNITNSKGNKWKKKHIKSKTACQDERLQELIKPQQPAWKIPEITDEPTKKIINGQLNI